jgi:zinc protease
LKLSDHHADYPALMLANYIFGGGSGNRLFARIRTKEGLSYGVNSGLTARHSEESGTFQVFAISNPQNTAKVESTLKEEFAKALKEGFSAEEVDAAKKGWAQSRLVSRSSDQSLAMQLAQLAYQGRTMAFAAELDQKIAALTPEQVNGAFRKYITADQISFVKAGDFAKGASETK